MMQTEMLSIELPVQLKNDALMEAKMLDMSLDTLIQYSLATYLQRKQDFDVSSPSDDIKV